MGFRKCILVLGVLVVWCITGYSAHSTASGRSAKILEEPIVSPASSYEVVSSSDSKGVTFQDPSDRSLSVEHNMMLYRSVLSISLRLLVAFLVGKLLVHALSSLGILRLSQGVPIGPYHGDPNQLYSIDVNHNPGWNLPGASGSSLSSGTGGLTVTGTTLLSGTEGAPAAGSSLVTGSGSGGTGTSLISGTGLTATSSGAAAGAFSGTAPGVLAPVPASYGGYLTSATNARPNYLVPGGRPYPRFRFGFGGPRHPPLRRPPHMIPPVRHNMGDETHYIDTHSHLFVMPDGSQARVPIAQVATVQQSKPTATASSSTSSSSDAKTSASSTVSSASEATAVETASASSSSAAIAEKRSSSVFREKSSAYLPIQHQPYDDWSLHFSPGA